MAYDPLFYQNNKEKFAAKSKAWREANPEKAKENRRRHYEENREKALEYSRLYSLKRKFNLSEEEYTSMLHYQDGVCAICGNTSKKALAVDHCHKTGKIRGLLCNRCNRGIGYLRDDPNVLNKASLYITKGGFCGS